MNLKMIILSFISALALNAAGQTAPQWQWAQGLHGPDSDQGLCLAIDRDNNIYVSGHFNSDTMTAGAFYVSDTTTLYTDVFIAKYDSAGQIKWLKSYGGARMEYAGRIFVDQDNNVYFTGHFDSPELNIEGVVLLNPTSPNLDFFILKLDSSGSLLWVKSYHGSNYEASSDLSVDSAGNIFLIGCFDSPDLDLGGVVLSASGSDDVFTAMLDPFGNCIWAKTAGGGFMDLASTLERDHAGNVYSACSSESPNIVFNGSPPISFSSPANFNLYLAKYSSAGALLDVKCFGGYEYEDGGPMAFDDANNMYFSGRFFSDSINIEGFVLNNPDRKSENFLVKYNNNDQAVWVEHIRGDGIVSDICVTHNNTILICGFFTDTIYLDNLLLTNPADGTAFIAEYDTDGNILWAKYAGISGRNRATSMAIDNNCRVYLGGDFEGKFQRFPNEGQCADRLCV